MSGIGPVKGLGPAALRSLYENESGISKANPTGGGFGTMLTELVTETDRAFDHAGEIEKSMLLGEATDVHEVMVANAEAGVAFTLIVEIRNKLMEAYDELMRMQV